jgi:hypothetical protein
VRDRHLQRQHQAVLPISGKEQLDIPIEATSFNDEGEEEGSKPLTIDELKEEILSNLTDDTVILLPQAKRLPASVRYWFEDAISSSYPQGVAQGAKLTAFSPINPMKDMFLGMLEVELDVPDDRLIRARSCRKRRIAWGGKSPKDGWQSCRLSQVAIR